MKRVPCLWFRQRGFGAIAAIVVLVILAALAAAMTRFGSVQQLTSAQDVLSVRALVAARSGLEWGMYKAMQPGNWCDTNPLEHLDLMTETGFLASVKCEKSATYHEGEETAGTPNTFDIYTLTVTACNMPTAGACPNPGAVATPGYVERQLQAAVSKK